MIPLSSRKRGRWSYLFFRGKIIKRAQEKKEIKPELDSLLLAQHFRYLFYGQSYDDALNNGLDVDRLKKQFMFLYNIIKY